jgi:hypothetical protein
MRSPFAERKLPLLSDPFIPAVIALLLAAYVAFAGRPIPPRTLVSYILLRVAQIVGVGVGVGGLAASYVAVTVFVAFIVLLPKS